MKSELTNLEQALGIQFKNQDVLKESVTHRSYLNENPSWRLPHNERLEFLGDAVLELIVTEYLYSEYPDFQEGQLTSIRSALVNHIMLGKVAREVDLEKYLMLSKGESKDVGKAREVILANAIEAVIGAVYLDQGFEATSKVIARILMPHLEEVMKEGLYRDPKSLLQEIIQEQLKVTPTYRVLDEKGPDHQKRFLIGAFFGEECIAEGRGTSKQEAEREAAINALKKVESNKTQQD